MRNVTYIESEDEFVLQLINTMFEYIDAACKHADETGKQVELGLYMSAKGIDIISIEGHEFKSFLQNQITYFSERENFELCSIMVDYIEKLDNLFKLEKEPCN